jgi:hypothetical protein
VQLRKSEVTSSTLVTVHVEGELGAVQAAVEAGAAACRKVGRLYSVTIIPRPDAGLDVMLDTPSNLYVPGGPYCAIVPHPRTEPAKPKKEDAPAKPVAPKPARTRKRGRGAGPAGDYESMTVQALRRLARMRPNLPIAGRDIARADKDTLIQLLRDAGRKG